MAVLTGVLTMMPPLVAHADSGILSTFRSTYPASTSDNNANCQLCHGLSTSTYNEYGWSLRQNGENFAALEGVSSVNINGGTTMLDEITAGTQPGWTSGAVNNLYTNSGLFSSTTSPPVSISGALDPTVVNAPPTADPNGPYTGETGIAVMFDGSGSTDQDGSITAYAWDFGDGTGTTGTGATPSYTYSATGTYTVTLTVTDDDGDSSNPATTTATISTPSQPPVATFLAPGWSSSHFVTLGTPTRAIAFDSSKNLYIEDTGDDNSGEIEILQLTASSGYQSASRYALYATTYKGATGLAFDRMGSLYVAERDAFGDAGIIREINAATQTLAGDVMAFANHRPTGVDADASGSVFYSGRKESAGAWGKIFEIDTDVMPAVRTILIDDRVATGIAVASSGDIFISTPVRTDLPLLYNSIYRFAANDLLNPELIATFDSRGGELTFDAAGNLYMVANDQVNIIKLSFTAASGPLPWLPLLLD